MKRHSNLCRFILLTLTDLSGRGSITREKILERIRKCFTCSSIIIAQEGLSEKGHHFFVGIKKSDARKNKASRILKEAFPEFEGAQMNVSFNRLRRFLYSFLFVAIMVLVMYLICLCMGSINSFFVLLSKAGVSLGGRALSLALCKGLGCSGGLALAIGFAARALFASEAPAALPLFMNEDGSAGAVDASTSGASDESSSSSSEEV